MTNLIREIHFYTDLCNEKQVSEWDLEEMCTDYKSTETEINRCAVSSSPSYIVKTTQLCFLRNAFDYIDRGIRVFVHLRDMDMFECGETGKVVNPYSSKEIRKGHNYEQLLIGGAFGKF